MEKGKFRLGGLLVAGPTAGKSFLQSKLSKNDDYVLDTDTMIERVMPTYFSKGHYRDQSEQGRMLSQLLEREIARDICDNISDKTGVVTNIWTRNFLDACLGKDRKPLLYVGLTDWKEIQRRSRKRGSMLSEGLCKKWCSRLIDEVPLVFTNYIFLPNDLYLSDVVDFRLHENQMTFGVTKKGKELVKSSPLPIQNTGFEFKNFQGDDKAREIFEMMNKKSEDGK